MFTRNPFVSLFAVCAFASLAGGLACGSSSSDGGGGSSAQTCPYDYSKFDGTTPAVSFGTDVLPLFRNSCATSNACHGDPAGGGAKLYLGPKSSDTTTVIDTAFKQKIIDAMVGKPSLEAPSMNLVTASDPANSFMMVKMDGCEEKAGLTCTPQPGAVSGNTCGDNMPQGVGVLSASQRDKVRRWISQGAGNN